MGNFLSQSTVENNEIMNLRHRLMCLESIDRNNDGYISKDEYFVWLHNQEKDLERFKNDIIETKESESRDKINKLEDQIRSLKEINKDLEIRLKEQANIISTHSSGSDDSQRVLGEISQNYIDQEIDKILANNESNASLIPDYLERRLYRNVFKMLFGLIGSLSSTSQIKFLHHKLTFQVEADDKYSDDL